MIRNRRQLATAERKLGAAEAGAEASSGWERDTYMRIAHQLRHEIQEYKAVSSGVFRQFKLSSLDDIPEALVKARIAQGWTQRELAERLEVTEQMVQQDEAGGYASAGLHRIADVVDALGYAFEGRLQPCELTQHPTETRSISFTRVSGFPAVSSSETGGVYDAWVSVAGMGTREGCHA